MRFIFIISFCLLPLISISQEEFDKEMIYISLEKALENPSQVYHLDLSKQRLKEFPLALLRFQNLETLDLSKNKISLLPAEIGELKRLRKLDLGNNKFSIVPPQIGKLKQLTYLNLKRNTISSLPEEVIQLEKLEELNLWKTEVKEMPEGMEKMSNLQMLDLRGFIIPDEEKERLNSALPNTKIYFTNGCYCGSGFLKN